MRTLGILALIASIALAGTTAARAGDASPAPAAPAAPTASPSPDPQVLAQAKAWFHNLQTGKIDRSQLSANVQSSVTDAQIVAVSAKLQPLGDPVTFEQEQTAVRDGSHIYIYLVTFGNSTKLDYLYAVDASGKISGLQVRPAQSTP